MLNARPLLKDWLSDADLSRLGQSVVNGYRLCDSVMSQTPLFSAFAIGRDFRSHMLGLAVEFELNRLASDVPEYFSEIKPNAARNCWHLRLNVNGLILTSHFMGRRDFRTNARMAKNREALAGINGDLFEEDSSQIDLYRDKGFAYCQLLHGGSSKPLLSMLVIPNRGQTMNIAACPLPIPEPDTTKVESIKEEFLLQLIQQATDIENEEAEQAS